MKTTNYMIQGLTGAAASWRDEPFTLTSPVEAFEKLDEIATSNPERQFRVVCRLTITKDKVLKRKRGL